VVVPTKTTLPALDFFQQRFPFIDRTLWQARLQSGDVVDDQGAQIHPDQVLHSGQRMYYFRFVPHEPAIPFQESIVWQDDHLLVVDKPHFLPVIPSGKYVHETLLVRLKNKLGIEALSPIHRIDRDTAGLVLFSVNPHTRNAYQALFRDRLVHKTYHAVAPWNPALTWPVQRASRIAAGTHFMQQTEVSGAPNAHTTIRPLQVRGDLALYELHPLTGLRHQLRVHMAALGMPLVGDGIYPVLTPECAPDFTRPLQLLAKAIAFTDPVIDQYRQFESPRTLW
jgi:tRNA pseudouridine32 synthase/23S rRNA pseudouridine746 synthase